MSEFSIWFYNILPYVIVGAICILLIKSIMRYPRQALACMGIAVLAVVYCLAIGVFNWVYDYTYTNGQAQINEVKNAIEQTQETTGEMIKVTYTDGREKIFRNATIKQVGEIILISTIDNEFCRLQPNHYEKIETIIE